MADYTEEQIIAEIAKLVSSILSGIEKAAMEIVSVVNNIPFEEVAKYNRRKKYHKRLSDRNRLHPKKKPKGGR